MISYRTVLRRVGGVLMIIGIADIAFMIYCINNNLAYSSSFNVFALIAGLFLWFGHLGAARFITAAAAFFFSGFLAGTLLFMPLMRPLGLWLLYLRQQPMQTLFGLLFVAAVVALMHWIYKQLRSEPVLRARQEAGQSVAPPKAAFVLGPMIPLVLLVVFALIRYGDTGKTAVSLAKAQVGEGYEFHIESFHTSGSGGRATVIAYNDSEAKTVEVKW